MSSNSSPRPRGGNRHAQTETNRKCPTSWSKRGRFWLKWLSRTAVIPHIRLVSANLLRRWCSIRLFHISDISVHIVNKRRRIGSEIIPGDERTRPLKTRHRTTDTGSGGIAEDGRRVAYGAAYSGGLQAAGVEDDSAELRPSGGGWLASGVRWCGAGERRGHKTETVVWADVGVGRQRRARVAAPRGPGGVGERIRPYRGAAHKGKIAASSVGLPWFCPDKALGKSSIIQVYILGKKRRTFHSYRLSFRARVCVCVRKSVSSGSAVLSNAGNSCETRNWKQAG